MPRLGVLALQGDVIEHVRALAEAGAEACEVRRPPDLEGLDALIIPGGESTAIRRLMDKIGLTEPLQSLARRGFPLWGTCAGAILLAKRLDPTGKPCLEAMDIAVCRNAFGRQVDSFEADLDIPAIGPPPFPGVFIRAPIIEAVDGPAEVLARLPDGRIVAARQGPFLATAFHPELTADRRLHRYFLDMAAAHP